MKRNKLILYLFKEIPNIHENYIWVEKLFIHFFFYSLVVLFFFQVSAFIVTKHTTHIWLHNTREVVTDKAQTHKSTYTGDVCVQGVGVADWDWWGHHSRKGIPQAEKETQRLLVEQCENLPAERSYIIISSVQCQTTSCWHALC